MMRVVPLCLVLALAGCDQAAAPRSEVQVSGPTMGTHYSVKVVGDYPGG